jgi:hypothetical protein
MKNFSFYYKDIKGSDVNIIKVICPNCNNKNTHGLGKKMKYKNENMKVIERMLGHRVCRTGCEGYKLNIIQ